MDFWSVTLKLLEGFGTSCLLFLLTLLFTVIVDAALTAKLKRINMAEAMKAIE